MKQTIYIPYGTKKYPLIISDINGDIEAKNEPWAIRVKCEVANLDQYYYIEDLWELIAMLPELIEEAKQIEKRESFLKIRINQKEKLELENLASKSWYKNISSYIRSKVFK